MTEQRYKAVLAVIAEGRTVTQVARVNRKESANAVRGTVPLS